MIHFYTVFVIVFQIIFILKEEDNFVLFDKVIWFLLFIPIFGRGVGLW